MQPLSPEELKQSLPIIPEEVIQVVNELLRNEYRPDEKSVTILQEDIIKKLVNEHNMDRKEIFNRKYLDFEMHFRDKGWTVVYHKPQCWADESFSSYFEFTFSK